MKLGNYFSYKTFYYFLKDISFIDFTKYKRIVDDKGVKYDEDYFWALFDEGREIEDDIILVKTKYGYFCYHNTSDSEVVKDFLIKASKNAPCGVFGSYRTVDVYLAGIAENGKVKRFLYTEEGEAVIEGERTAFEIENNFDAREEDFESQLDFFDEENIFSYAKWFAGFDIENEDVEVMDVIHLTPCPLSDKLDGDIVKNIYTAFNRNGLLDIAISFAYDKSNGETIIACENVVDNNRYAIYCDSTDLNNKEEFLSSLKRCFNAIISYNLNENNKTMTSISSYYSCLKNKNCNVVCYLLDIERKFMNSLLLLQKRGKILNQNFFTTLFYGKINYQLNDFVLNDVYARAKKLLKK